MSQSTTGLTIAIETADELVVRVTKHLRTTNLLEATIRYQPAALNLHAEKVTTPLLVQVSDTELMATAPAIVALKHAGKPVETYVFPDEHHGKFQPQHKLAVYRRSIDWLRFWLQDYEDPDHPTKASQYARWRKTRVARAAQ